MSKLNVEKMVASLQETSDSAWIVFERGGDLWQKGYAEALGNVISDIEEGFWDE